MGANILTKTDRQMEDRMMAVASDPLRADTLQKARSFKRTWLELAQVDIGKVQESTSETLTVMLLAIASVSLLVGAIGIMNLLLVSVTERTREIGVRMAVGAKRRHIMIQFLVEAVTLSVTGGCLGIFVGVLGARMTTVVAGWPTIISGQTVAVAFVFSVAVGLFFGLYPANKAARLNPIDALRFE